MQRVKNIIFDLGGVLVGLDGQRCIEAFNRLGCQAVSRYVEEHRTEDLFYRIELGLISTQEFCQEIRLMTHTAASDQQLVHAWNELLTELSSRRRQRLISLHRQGYRLFLLSNTNDMHWQHCRQQLFGPDVIAIFERIFLSYEMQLSKPAPAIFTSVLSQTALQPEETLFIDDNRQNIEAAAALGIGTYHNTSIDDWVDALQIENGKLNF